MGYCTLGFIKSETCSWKTLEFAVIIILFAYSSSFSSHDSLGLIQNPEDTPIRPIAQTVLGPTLLICGIVLTCVSISSLVYNARNEEPTGTLYGPMVFMGTLLTIGGSGFSIGGGIVTISAIRRWKRYKKINSDVVQ